MRQGLATHWSLLLFILNLFLCTPSSSRLCGEDIAPADWMTIPRCWNWDTAYERSQPRSGRRTNCATRRHPPWTTSFDINTSPTFWRPWKTSVRLCQFWLFTHMKKLELPATLFSLWTSWSSWPLTCTHHHPAFWNRVEQDKCQMWEKVPLLLLFWLCVVIAKCLSCVVQIRQFITYKGAYCVPPKSEVCNVKSKLLFMWAWSRVFSASRCPEH